MGWKCTKCGATDPSDNLDFPIMHELMKGSDHQVEPDLETTLRWGRVLGVKKDEHTQQK